MTELLKQIWVHVQDHGVKILVGLFFMAIGWWFGLRKARRDWSRREFLDRLNVSLNWIEDGTLKFRTLSEKRCDEIFLNKHAADQVRHLAQLTTATNPVLPLPKDDAWYYLNSLLNELSEQFAEGAIRQEMGLPNQTATYLICLTNEVAGSLRTRKIRAMLIRRSLLEQLPAEQPKLENHHHGTRWETLKVLAQRWKIAPHEFLEVSLALPK